MEELLKTIVNSRDRYSACMGKFWLQKEKDGEDFIPNDQECIKTINFYWNRISMYCTHENCERIAEKEGWERQHKNFVRLLGHTKKERGMFCGRVFSENLVFWK